MMEARCHMRPWGRSIEVLLAQRHGPALAVGWPVSFVDAQDAGKEIAEPTFSLTLDAAQELMDGLWQCGIRPSEGSGSAGALAATERHLRDLQRLLFEERVAEAPARPLGPTISL